MEVTNFLLYDSWSRQDGYGFSSLGGYDSYARKFWWQAVIILIKDGGSSGGTKRGFGGYLLSMFLSNQIGELLRFNSVALISR